MLGVYIHIPFCEKICTYCDFCKILYNSKYVNKYLVQLQKEINERYKGELVNTIYIGGGTPSALSVLELNYLLKILSVFNLESKYEYTVECNIESIDMDKLILFKKYGINRISYGVESFNRDVQKILGRCHDEEMIFNKIDMTKKYFKNINIDLIYGVVDDIKKVIQDIDKFLLLDIPHISCYSLILEEHTKLYIDGYKNISSDIDSEMYEYIVNTLSNNGYNHYEISNYAIGGYESVHNKNYWLNGNYYGFGLGAVSYLDNYRITNTKNINKYILGDYIDSKIYEDEKVRRENDLILGFRLVDGINIDEYDRRHNTKLLDSGVIKDMIDNGYLTICNGFIKCASEYLYLENFILEKIIGSDL